MKTKSCRKGTRPSDALRARVLLIPTGVELIPTGVEGVAGSPGWLKYYCKGRALYGLSPSSTLLL